MKLADFIRTNQNLILQNWEMLAQNNSSYQKNGVVSFPCDAKRRLDYMAEQLDAVHSRSMIEPGKSRQLASQVFRIFQQNNINTMLAEYQTLREILMRLWSDNNASEVQPDPDAIRALNSDIDQTIFHLIDGFLFDCTHKEKLFDALISTSSDLYVLLDPDGAIMYGNRIFSKLIGQSRKDYFGKRLIDYNSIENNHLQRDLYICLKSKNTVKGELTWPKPYEADRTFEYFLVPLLDDSGVVEAVSILAKDKTERILMEEKCYRQANYDSLTGLPNRNLFRDRLSIEVNRVERNATAFALLFLDLDGFKEINDGYGHAAGDQLLALAGQRIHSCVRSTDTVARLGGDEFTVIITDMNHIASIELLAQKILAELSRPFHIGQKEVKISGSMGITLCPHDGMNPDDLLRNADQAMYVSKNAGRNQFNFFTLSMRNSAWARLKVIEQLRHALPMHQLIVLFQPVIDLATDSIVKAEALLRWQHPELGLMYPYEFINLAEEIGLIVEIDNWVFNESLICAKKWSDTLGYDFQVSVNKSPFEFSKKIVSSDWGSHLQSLIHAARYIAVEITEKIFLHDSPIAKDRISDLQNSGIELIIDHFGIGHSLMAYLRKFDANYLKMDQSFIRDVLTNESSRTMYETMVVMAHKLSLKAIATGVENVEQRNWLKAINCDMAQGYFFSRPLAFDEFTALLMKHREASQIGKK